MKQTYLKPTWSRALALKEGRVVRITDRATGALRRVVQFRTVEEAEAYTLRNMNDPECYVVHLEPTN